MLTLLAVALTAPPDPAELLPKLTAGGLVLFLRHPATNPDQADTDPFHLDNVAAQRQLTAAGRADAKAIGAAWTTLKVPVAEVLTSKYRRAVEAGELLGVGPVTPLLDLTEGGQVVTPTENRRRAEALKALLGKPVTGGNRVIVSHRPNLQDAAGKEYGDLGEGEVAIFRPLGEGKFEAVARVSGAAVWQGWAAGR